MAKWSKKYTTLENVNGGNEYETGDHITKETVNVALNNTAYLQQTKVTAETNKGLVTQRFLDKVDLNTVLINGFYGCNAACTNKPNEDGPGQMLVINRDDNWVGQLYINMNQGSKASSNRVHTRGYDNSKKVWSSWKQIDNDPSLYNLGAYDTYVDNGDGTTTITRKTGYLDLSKKQDKISQYDNVWHYSYSNIPTMLKGGGLKSPGYTQGNNKSTPFSLTHTTDEFYINNNSTTVKPTIIITYELATSYTETIITGLPQITLDKQGCEWLRSEWEKGLNLWNKYQDNMNEGANKASIKSNTDNEIVISVTNSNDPYIFGKKIVNLPRGTYTLSYYRSIGGAGTYANIDGKYLVFSTTHSGMAYLKFTITSTTTINIRFGGDITGNNEDTTYTDFMLVKGSVPYPYQPYNSAYNITNEQADLLSDEEELSRNLWDEQWEVSGLVANAFNSKNFIKVNSSSSYFLRSNNNMGIDVWEYNSSKTFLRVINIGTNGHYTSSNDCAYIKFRMAYEYGTTYNSPIMLNKGSTALPYAPYNGSIVHEKHLSLQAPSMGHKTANECMMNVTGEYYNNSSSDVYILLGSIKPSFKEARDGGFIINGTIGQYYYTQQAQINAVAYWRDKAKWKGSYTQDNSDGNFYNVVDLIITDVYNVYLVIKAGQFGQYNLQLQGVTIKYTGDILTAKVGSTASTFSQSEAIDLTALDTGLSDKLKFIDNNAITDPDGTGNYKIDNSYIYDEELATNGVDYLPFDGSSSYDSQSGINADFYNQIKKNKENISNKHLYHTTIIHAWNTISYGQNIGEIFEVTIFTNDDKTDYNTPGTAWTILQDYLNNNGYTLGNVANWITSNQVYPCNGQLLKYSPSGSVSLTYNIYGISYNNGKFYVHYYTNTNAYSTSELSCPDSYWRIKSTKIF